MIKAVFIIMRVLRVLVLFASIFLFGNLVFADDAENERETKIKIAYLFHFSQFTEWTPQPPIFNYCVYEDTHFSYLLKQAYSSKKLNNSKIEVLDITEKSNVDDCQLVYFHNKISNDLLDKIHKKPILSIGSQKSILEQGIIYLFEEDQKIRFFINNTAALAAGLKISSQLLALSKEPM